LALGSPLHLLYVVMQRTYRYRLLGGRNALSSLWKVCSLLMASRSTAESGLYAPLHESLETPSTCSAPSALLRTGKLGMNGHFPTLSFPAPFALKLSQGEPHRLLNRIFAE
jgi:hypothetical protein